MQAERFPTLGSILTEHAYVRGSKTALSFDGVSTSYQELGDRAKRIANGLLRLGVAPGDRVAFIGKNSGAYFEALIGAAKARAVL